MIGSSSSVLTSPQTLHLAEVGSVGYDSKEHLELKLAIHTLLIYRVQNNATETLRKWDTYIVASSP